jgi:hypothetical protein
VLSSCSWATWATSSAASSATTATPSRSPPRVDQLGKSVEIERHQLGDHQVRETTAITTATAAPAPPPPRPRARPAPPPRRAGEATTDTFTRIDAPSLLPQPSLAVIALS